MGFVSTPNHDHPVSLAPAVREKNKLAQTKEEERSDALVFLP
jgi:hypothetical protein